jgi:biotin carboxyl carrier protein
MSKQDKKDQLKDVPQLPMEELEIGGAVYTTRLTAKFKNRTQWEPVNQNKILAVIPGTIQEVMKAEGDAVAAGESMLILEAMKMRNEIKAPRQGRIKKINVSQGEQVAKSHLLVELE